ncbi:FkbM family methyltransferase [bacterium]|nr:FkbM family methyltransferase [bacterium]
MRSWLTGLVKRVLHAAGYDIRNRRHAFIDPFADIAEMLKDVPEPVVFDVGANRGETVAIIRKLLPRSQVYAFEPTPDLADALRIRFHKDSRVRIVDSAVSNCDGSADLRLRDCSLLNSLLDFHDSSHSYYEVRDTGSTPVKTTKLTTFCNKNCINYVHALKLDIEGAEKYAIEGSRELLNSHAVGIIYLEIHFSKTFKNQTTLGDIDTVLRQYGYEVYGIYEMNRFMSGSLYYCNIMYLSHQVYNTLPSHGVF